MSKIVHDTWQLIMNHQRNPLKHIPDLNTRHMVDAGVSMDVVYSFFYVLW